MLCFAMKSRSVERALDGRESRGEAFASFATRDGPLSAHRPGRDYGGLVEKS
jgi:hypothetical protein